MSHCLILGMTESGKTTLGKQLAAQMKERGMGVIVLDPLNDPGWNADIQFTDEEEFLECVWKSKKCLIVIDEAGESAGRYATAMHGCATRARHWGHTTLFICQRAAQLSPTVRDNCGHLFLFRSGRKDRATHAEEWGAPEIEEGELAMGEYMHVTRDGKVVRGQVF